MADFFSKWLKGLDKTRKVTFSRLASIFGTNEITDETWDELEETLLQADVGIETTESIIEAPTRSYRWRPFACCSGESRTPSAGSVPGKPFPGSCSRSTALRIGRP